MAIGQMHGDFGFTLLEYRKKTKIGTYLGVRRLAAKSETIAAD
jgi:hypothetical protein